MKCFVRLAVAPLAIVSGVNAVTMPDFEIDLENGDNIECIKKLCAERFEIGVGAWIMQEAFRAHMWNIVQEKHPDYVDPGSIRYFSSVYKIIPTEIVRCFLRIRGGIADYKEAEQDFYVECVGDGIKESFNEYTLENWNYFMLINVLYQCLKSDTLSENIIDETCDKLIQMAEDIGDMDLSVHKTELEEARDDIKQYFKDLKLFEFLQPFVNKDDKSNKIIDNLVKDALELERLNEKLQICEKDRKQNNSWIADYKREEEMLDKVGDQNDVNEYENKTNLKERAMSKGKFLKDLQNEYRPWDSVENYRHNVKVYIKFRIDRWNKRNEELESKIRDIKGKIKDYEITNGELANERQLETVDRFMDNLCDNEKSPIYGTDCRARSTNDISNKLLASVGVLRFWANHVQYIMSVDTKDCRTLIITIERSDDDPYWEDDETDTPISWLANEKTRFYADELNWTHDKNNEIFKTLRTVSNHIREKEDQTEHERVMMRFIEINNRLPLLKLPLLGMPYGDMHHDDMFHSNYGKLQFATELRDMAEYYRKSDNKEYDLSKHKTEINLLNRCFEDIQQEYKRISAK